MRPLDGLKIVEFGSIGPGPFAGMLLSDLGATVVRLHRFAETSPVALDGMGADHRGRVGVAVDLKDEADRELALELVTRADAVIEGFRPGVMERLGLGPEEAHRRNPRVVYGRVTGYGQEGPLAQDPGHDINYLAISGVLSTLGRAGERPLPPLNLLGDYGGGGMLLALGVVSALFEARRTGRGCVVDAAMIDGVAQLATVIFSFAGAGSWGPTGSNVLDSGAHFYEVYETADGGFVAVGAIEPQFYAELLRILEIDPADAPQWDRRRWPELKERFAEAFRSRTRAGWTALTEHTDACVSPVLDLDEAARHPHNLARGTFTARAEGALPAGAPRFDRIAADPTRPVPDTADTLLGWGLPAADVDRLMRRTSAADSSR